MNIGESDIFDLRTYDNGYCHTYNPPKATTTNFVFQLGLFLGHSVKNMEYNFVSLFVHEKDQFWPRLSKQYKEVTFGLDRALVLSFKLISHINLFDNKQQYRVFYEV